jgi:hypothetical protein
MSLVYHLTGSGLLDYLVRLPTNIAYPVFKEAPHWFFEDLAKFFLEKHELFSVVLQFIEIDIKNSDCSSMNTIWILFFVTNFN